MAKTSLMPGYTVSADLVRGLIDCAAMCGVPRRQLARLAVQSTATTSTEAESRYLGVFILDLWERIIRLADDPIIGYRMALVARPKTFGLLGQILPRCATVLEACRQTARYSAIASQWFTVAVSCDANGLVVSVSADLPPGVLTSNIMLWALTNASLLPQRMLNEPLRPKLVECALAAPGRSMTAELRKELPFRFGCGRNRVVFDRAIADRPIPTADAELQQLIIQLAEQQLRGARQSSGFKDSLLSVMRGMINGTIPTLASVSARTNMSTRTLQRRLSEHGTTFQGLLQEVLRETSDRYLARGDLTQAEIAFLIGYSDESAFSRAYKSWTGRAPGGHRLENSAESIDSFGQRRRSSKSSAGRLSS